ncbi:MAG: hypothetical protein ACHQIK_21875 [Candidatus Acidiferrales bacterium]
MRIVGENLRSKVTVVALSLVLFPNLFAQTSLEDKPTWLRPNDAEYQIVIAAAFPHKGDKKQVKILHFDSRLQMDPFSRFLVKSPLACAFDVADSDHNKLEEPPSVQDVKDYCDGQLKVLVTHFSVNLNVKRPVVIQHGGQTLRPTSSSFDGLPQVTTYIAGLLNSDQVGYRYIDLHSFKPDSAWNDNVLFVTADEFGNQKTLTFDFGKFEKNEMEIRAEIKK